MPIVFIAAISLAADELASQGQLAMTLSMTLQKPCCSASLLTN